MLITTLTQLENFEAAVRSMDATIVVNSYVDSNGDEMVSLSFPRPEQRFVRIAVNSLLRNIGAAHGLQFDGYNALGFRVCFAKRPHHELRPNPRIPLRHPIPRRPLVLRPHLVGHRKTSQTLVCARKSWAS